MHDGGKGAPLTSLSNGTALNHGSLLIALSFSVPNPPRVPASARPAPSTYDSVLCAGLHTKLLIAASSALTWLPEYDG
jgi:hypothetical protein